MTEVLAVIGVYDDEPDLVTDVVLSNFKWNRGDEMREVFLGVMGDIIDAVEVGVTDLKVEKTTTENLLKRGLTEYMNIST